MQVIQFHNGGFTWVNCRLTIIDDLLRDNFGFSLSSLCVESYIRPTRHSSLDGRSMRHIEPEGHGLICIIKLKCRARYFGM